jgi:ribose transport system permease protein
MHFLLSQTVFGHEVYAIGGNREAARLAGINVRRVETLVYVTAGTLSGLASIVLTGRLTAALPSSATGFELDVIAAVVIGGASLFGGRGSMVGTFFGAFYTEPTKDTKTGLGLQESKTTRITPPRR